MPIEFHCEHCGKYIKAPDEAGGRRGKCPYCGQSNYVPASQEADEIPVAPVDEDEEQRRQKTVEELRAQERELIAESGGDEGQPPQGAAGYYPDQEDGAAADEVAPGDLYHHVVQYCLSVSNSELEKAEEHAEKLRAHGYTGLEAVDDFLTGKELSPELDAIPTKLLNGFLQQLRERVR